MLIIKLLKKAIIHIEDFIHIIVIIISFGIEDITEEIKKENHYTLQRLYQQVQEAIEVVVAVLVPVLVLALAPGAGGSVHACRFRVSQRMAAGSLPAEGGVPRWP